MPICVCEDLDRIKLKPGDLGANARQVIRELDALRQRGNLATGVCIDERGGVIRVLTHGSGLTANGDRVLPRDTGDISSAEQVLRYALSLSKAAERLGDSKRVILVSKDMVLRVRANALQLEVQDYLSQATDVDEFYRGYRTIAVDAAIVEAFAYREDNGATASSDAGGEEAKTETETGANESSSKGVSVTNGNSDSTVHIITTAPTAAAAAATTTEKEEDTEAIAPPPAPRSAAGAPAALPFPDTCSPLQHSRAPTSATTASRADYQDMLADLIGPVLPNEFLVLADKNDPTQVSVVRVRVGKESLTAPVVPPSPRRAGESRLPAAKTESLSLLFDDVALEPVPLSVDAWNITSRGLQQAMALELLLDDSVSLVTLVGRAGTGKTLIALAAGLTNVVHRKLYKSIIVTRPIMPLGNDIGYLPGSKEAKMTSWMQPIFDNLEFLSNVTSSQAPREAEVPRNNPFHALSTEAAEDAGLGGGERTDPSATISPSGGVRTGSGNGKGKRRRRRRQRSLSDADDKITRDRYRELGYAVNESGDEEAAQRILGTKAILKSVVNMEAVTYIRGRSIEREFIILDECQNMTPHEVKTVISRAGDGTKIILCGDPQQIDNPYLDTMTNGLTYAAERMKGLALHGHVRLKRTERSNLAAAAAELL